MFNCTGTGCIKTLKYDIAVCCFLNSCFASQRQNLRTVRAWFLQKNFFILLGLSLQSVSSGS